jgi:hypothetical protein
VVLVFQRIEPGAFWMRIRCLQAQQLRYLKCDHVTNILCESVVHPLLLSACCVIMHSNISKWERADDGYRNTNWTAGFVTCCKVHLLVASRLYNWTWRLSDAFSVLRDLRSIGKLNTLSVTYFLSQPWNFPVSLALNKIGSHHQGLTMGRGRFTIQNWWFLRRLLTDK